MAIIEAEEFFPERRHIDLRGPAGNAFNILGVAADFAKQLEWPKEKKDGMMEDMMSGDYEHLLETFNFHFGSICDLIR